MVESLKMLQNILDKKKWKIGFQKKEEDFILKTLEIFHHPKFQIKKKSDDHTEERTDKKTFFCVIS